MKRIDCPFIEGAFIELPDEWLGEHARRHDAALAKARKAELGDTETQFCLSMALVENWGGIPGLDGNPDKWDFGVLSFSLISWIVRSVLPSYQLAWLVPANFSLPSPAGSTSRTGTAEKAAGSSESEPQSV